MVLDLMESHALGLSKWVPFLDLWGELSLPWDSLLDLQLTLSLCLAHLTIHLISVPLSSQKE